MIPLMFHYWLKDLEHGKRFRERQRAARAKVRRRKARR